MQTRELLTIYNDDIKLCIVQEALYIGVNDYESTKEDVTFDLQNGELTVNEYKLTPVMLLTLKAYLNGEL